LSVCETFTLLLSLAVPSFSTTFIMVLSLQLHFYSYIFSYEVSDEFHRIRSVPGPAWIKNPFFTTWWLTFLSLQSHRGFLWWSHWPDFSHSKGTMGKKMTTKNLLLVEIFFWETKNLEVDLYAFGRK
jgi:hypothetical protein